MITEASVGAFPRASTHVSPSRKDLIPGEMFQTLLKNTDYLKWGTGKYSRKLDLKIVYPDLGIDLGKSHN